MRIAPFLIAGLLLAGCGSSTVKTVTVDKAPVAALGCLRLQDDARRLANATLSATEHMADFQPLIPEAAEAGQNRDAGAAERIVAKENVIVATIRRGTKAVERIIGQDRADNAQCEAALASP